MKMDFNRGNPKNIFLNIIKAIHVQGSKFRGGTEYPVGDAKLHVSRVPGGRGG